MLKNSLAMMIIGSLLTGSSFATPLYLKKMFINDQMMKSSSVSKKHAKNSQFKFNGTWAGMCDFNGDNQEAKLQIDEDNKDLTITDLTENGGTDTHSFNVVETEGRSDKDWYDTFTSRLTRIDENTLRFEGTGVFGHQLPSSSKEKIFVSGLFTSMYKVNNNQLTIDANGKLFRDNQAENFEMKCVLKRAD